MAAVNMVGVDDDDEELIEETPQGVEAIGLGVSETVASALAGDLSPDYIRKYYENDKLKPKHMKMLRMAVAGYSNNQIAEVMDYTPGRVSIILNHQDSLTIMARMVGAAADRLGVAERLQALAPEMIEHVVGITRSTHDYRLKSRNAFELLKLAGHSGVTKVELTTPGVAASPALLGRLSAALEESNALRSEAYDPRTRSMPAAAANMMEGEVVEITTVDSGSTAGDVGVSAIRSAVPPGRDARPLSLPLNVASNITIAKKTLDTVAAVVSGREPSSEDIDAVAAQ